MRWLIQFCAAIAASFVVAALSLAPARAAEGGLPADTICGRYIAEAEKALDIPCQLLLAIGVVELGVWSAERARSTAWPWTVYVRMHGQRFSDKAAALAEIQELYNHDVLIIDVGCMQINIGYHGHAFASLEEALDPAHNVAYAAQLLKSLYRDARSWSTAIARYHSWTPRLARLYHNKVKQPWATSRRAAYEDRRIADQDARQARRAVRAERKRLRSLADAG